MKKATRQHTKRHNTRLVLRTIYDAEPISRADIARATNLTRPTVSRIVTDLMGDNFVVEIGLGQSAGGRRPVLLRVASDSHCLIAVDLGSRSFRGAVVDLRGRIYQRVTFPTANRQGEAALALVFKLLEALIQTTDRPILGIGIGTPGLTNPFQGVIRAAVNLGWTDLPLAKLVEDRLDFPVFVANDCHMAALGEYTFGQDRDSDNLVVIKIGQGVGAGIVLQGQPYFGDGFGAGEIGHVVVDIDGERCRCGNSGCLETKISTRAIMAKIEGLAQQEAHASEKPESSVDWETFTSAMAAGDPEAAEIVATAGRFLGVAIANLIAALNIYQVVISGWICVFGDVLLKAALAETQRRVLPAMAADTTLRCSSLGSDIVLLGCSAMVLKQELGIV